MALATASKYRKLKQIKNYGRYPMVLKLYAIDGSPAARAVMMICEIFEIPYEKVEVDLLAGENLKPEYLKLNPMHTIPVLQDGDFVLHESRAMMIYLTETYGKDDSWYPKDVKQRALVNQKLFFDTSILFPRLRNLTVPIILQGLRVIEQSRYDDIEEAYGFLEEFLSRTKFLAADHMTIADVSALSNVTGHEIFKPIDEKKFPKTAAWLKYMKNTSFAKKCNEPGVNFLEGLIKEKLAS